MHHLLHLPSTPLMFLHSLRSPPLHLLHCLLHLPSTPLHSQWIELEFESIILSTLKALFTSFVYGRGRIRRQTDTQIEIEVRMLGSLTKPHATVFQRHSFTYSSAIILYDKSLETHNKSRISSLVFRSRAKKTSSKHFGIFARWLIKDPAMDFGEEKTLLPQEMPLNHQLHRGTICVARYVGFIGPWLIMHLIERGYTIRETVRDTGKPLKTKHLLDLPRENERLTLWKEDLDDEGSFDVVVNGCEGIFHVSTPMDFEFEDPEVWLSFLCASYV